MSTLSQPATADLTIAQPADPIGSVLESLLVSLGYEFVASEWVGSGARGRVLRVYVDRAGGISLDDCTRLSPVIGNALDAAEAEVDLCRAVLAAPYVLEVSSPGLDRPLARRSHFERFVGRRVKIQLTRALEATSNRRTYHGVICAVRPDSASPDDDRTGVVDLEPLDGGEVTSLRLADFRRANLVYEG